MIFPQCLSSSGEQRFLNKYNQMIKRHLYIIAFGILLFIPIRSSGQRAMPDYICTGQTGHYYVTPFHASGSTYTWWIDGTVQTGFTTNEFFYTWNSEGTFMIEVQERSADGCPGPKRSGFVFVNPLPEILASATDSLICDGESVIISLRNPVSLNWGQWVYDFFVEPESGIRGNSGNGTYNSPSALNETLFNNDTVIRKLVYRFIPRIVQPDGEQACTGKEVKVTIRIHPQLKYTKEVSDYNGYNISCSGAEDGYIRIVPAEEQTPYTVSWNGPAGYASTDDSISGLIPGKYVMSLTGKNGCSISETFDLHEPEKIRIAFEVTPPSCPEKPDGVIRSYVIGGVPGADYSYLWSNKSPERNLKDVPQGIYTLTVTDNNGCTETEEIRVTSPRKSCLKIPEAFSPNGDNINDFWNIGDIEYYPDCEITVYNRWGQVVWKSARGYPKPWDGLSDGKKLPVDSYHYVIRLHSGSKLIIGDVTVVK